MGIPPPSVVVAAGLKVLWGLRHVGDFPVLCEQY